MHYMGVRQWMQTEYVTTTRKYTMIIICSPIPGGYESKQNSAVLGSIVVCSLPSLIYIFFTCMNFRELIIYWMIQLDYTYSLEVVLRPLYGLIFRGLFNVKEINAFVCAPFTTRVFYALYFPSFFGSGCCRKSLHYIWAENVYMSYISYFVIYVIYFCYVSFVIYKCYTFSNNFNAELSMHWYTFYYKYA